MDTSDKIAFALGGLAGNNFHGAGVLEAALEKQKNPMMISCTTGQLYWVYEYLKAKDNGTRLEDIVKEEFKKLQPTPSPDWNWNWDIIRFLLPLYMPFRYMAPEAWEKFRPAALEWLEHFELNCLQSAQDMVFETAKDMLDKLNELVSNGKGGKKLEDMTKEEIKEMIARISRLGYSRVFYLKYITNNIPANLLIPVMLNKMSPEISEKFIQSKIAIVFNSYDPLNGQEHIYLNPTAMSILGKVSGQHSSFRSYDPSGTGASPGTGITRVYMDIDPSGASVREAIWLYEYGFDTKLTHLDGAYLRGVILSELTKAEKIFVARPINHKWIGQLPKTYMERLDLQTEVFFNGSYYGERDRIEMMNELLKNPDPKVRAVLSPLGFHHVDVCEIEVQTQRGFFDYAFEDLDVFYKAYEQAKKVM